MFFDGSHICWIVITASTKKKKAIILKIFHKIFQRMLTNCSMNEQFFISLSCVAKTRSSVSVSLLLSISTCWKSAKTLTIFIINSDVGLSYIYFVICSILNTGFFFTSKEGYLYQVLFFSWLHCSTIEKC